MVPVGVAKANHGFPLFSFIPFLLLESIQADKEKGDLTTYTPRQQQRWTRTL